MKISTIIIAKNEESVIARALKSVQWADEIILVDGESSDSTPDIAKKYNAKVYVNKWEGYVAQKKFALSKVTNNWVLSIDADEEVSGELAAAIKQLDFQSAGYKIKRENYFLGKLILSCGWNNDYQLRLFDKTKADLKERLVHEGFSITGQPAVIHSPIKHFTSVTVEKTFSKINRYSTLQALEQEPSKGVVKPVTIISHTLSAFLRSWISLKGYKEGVHGVIIAMMDAATTMLTYAKIWELKRNKK